jgi:predicted ATPase
MPDLRMFRERIQELYRTSRPYDDNRHPTQRDLADAIGLNHSELSNRLNASKGARLTSRDARAIVRTLTDWAAIYTQDEANGLLAMLDLPPFSAAELATTPLDRLTPVVSPPTNLVLTSSTATASSSPKSNLPRPLTSFIGRETEIAAVEELLQQSRLVTITGTGGAGKTRLAVEVAGRLITRFRDGVFLIELAALNDATLVAGQLAAVLALREQVLGDNLLDRLTSALSNKEMLLVLDNCEHLIMAVAQLTEKLLTTCPALHVLSTSREPLRIGGETVWRVPALSLPGSNVANNPNVIARYEAIRLFNERAAAAQPGFSINSQNVQLVRDICTQLDGIPLALELAAARLRVMGLSELYARLRDRFRLLVSGARTALPRQQTLQALVDWSCDLLTPSEAAVFRRLSLFVGGFTLDAAAAVCASEEISDFTAIEIVAELVDKSLVAREDNLGATRYYLPETIRQYAAAKLAAVPAEQQAVSRWQRDYYLSLTQQASSDENWPSRTALEHDNFRAALDWSLANDEAESAVRIAIAVGKFWGLQGYRSEAQHYLAAALEMGRGRIPQNLAARAWYITGNLAADAGDYLRGQELLEESAKIWQQLGDEVNLALALDSLGRVLLYQDEYRAATSQLEAALQLARKLNQRGDTLFIQANLGICALYQGNYLQAERLLHEALALSREYNNKVMQAIILYNLAALELDNARFEPARRYLEQTIKLADELGHSSLIARVQHLMGKVEEYVGNLDLAATLYQQSLAGAERLEDKSVIALASVGLASVTYQCGDIAQGRKLARRGIGLFAALRYRYDLAAAFEIKAKLDHAAGEHGRAAWLLGAATQLRENIGAPRPPVERESHARLVAELKAGHPEFFAGYYASGQQATIAGAVSYAFGADT